MLEQLRLKIEEHTKTASTKVKFVGQHILMIFKNDEAAVKLILEDLEGGAKLADIEKKIEAEARKNGGVCPPWEAEKIIREHFGLQEVDAPIKEKVSAKKSLMDFL